MKFSLLALAGALASANASVKTIKLGGNRHLRRGDATTEALIAKAVPVKKNRHLEAADEEDRVELDGSYSISFKNCVHIKTKSDDLFNEALVEQVQNGNVMAMKSFVLFNACVDNGYGCTSGGEEYMVDLATYLSVVGLKQVNKRSDYCEQCERYQDFW